MSLPCPSCLTISLSPTPLVTPGLFAPNVTLTFPLLRQSLATTLSLQIVDGVKPLALLTTHISAVPDFWAYVGDVLGLYNGVALGEALLATSKDRSSLRRLGCLLGYESRLAVGSKTAIAAFVSRQSSARLTATGYRAMVTNSSSAHVFEAAEGQFVGPRANEFILSPIREEVVGNPETDGLILESSTASAVRGRPVVFTWFDEVATQHATEVLDVKADQAADGMSYVSIRVAREPSFKLSSKYREISVMSPSQKAYARTALLNGEHGLPIGDSDTEVGRKFLGLTSGGHNGGQNHTVSEAAFAAAEKTQSFVDLDSVYRSISAGDDVILQYADYYSAHRVTETKEMQVNIKIDKDTLGPLIPITQLIVYPSIDLTRVSAEATGPLIVHYNMHDIGRLMRLAHTELTPELVLNTPLALEGVHSPIPTPPTEFILEDANGRGVLVDAKLAVNPSGAATLTVTKGEWTGGLRVPVKAYGNVVHVTRGETVENEVLGDGDQSQPYQTFRLARSPLTYLPSPESPRGIASTLEVRVDGVLWHERPSFYGARPNDPVYIVRHDDDQNTSITFGDGVRGLRLPTGSRNVRATYRHGAGADAPAPGAINQIVKGAPGLMYVRSPIQARGGADAESIRDIRRNAPASALVLGRCVSLADYSARLAGMPGIRNSKVEYAWDETSLTAGVKVWYVPSIPGTNLSKDIVANLRAMSEPGLVIRATPATPVESALFINLEIDPDYLPADIESAVQAALLDPEKGLLAPENTPIGGPLSRSAFVAVARAVPGVLNVTSVQFGLEVAPDSFPAPGLRLPAGHYFNFGGEYAGNVVVGAVRAESRGCRDLVS